MFRLFFENYPIMEVRILIEVRIWLLLIHIACLGIFFVPYNHSLLILTTFIFFIKTFAWEGGLHRYFSHRSYKTSRVFQFILAVVAASGSQRSPIWWAIHHRYHHKYSDTELDLHSPVHKGFLYAYLGWLVEPKNFYTDLDSIKDLSKYPEIVWINKYSSIFPIIWLLSIFCIGEYTALLGSNVGGISAVVWCFCFSTIFSLQVAFAVNALAHGLKPGFFNYRTYNTNDTTTNNWLLAIPTMGASWHNNHHRHMNSAKAGFYWWEIDLTFWILKILEFLGIIWDLKEVPEAVLQEPKLSQKNY